MKMPGQQPKPRRKKQKTDAAPAADAIQGLKHSLSPPPLNAQQSESHADAVAAADSHQQLQGVRNQPVGAGQSAVALGAGQFAAALGAGQTLRPPDPDSSSAALAKDPLQPGSRQVPEPAGGPNTLTTTHQAGMQVSKGGQQAQIAAAPPAMPPPRASGPAGQGYPMQHAGPGPSAAGSAGSGQQPKALAATQYAAGGGHPYSHSAAEPRRPPAMPAESQGGSMASDSAWGTEEERAQRKLQRQAEKQRMKWAGSTSMHVVHLFCVLRLQQHCKLRFGFGISHAYVLCCLGTIRCRHHEDASCVCVRLAGLHQASSIRQQPCGVMLPCAAESGC